MSPDPAAPRGAELLAHGRFLRSLARGLVADPQRAEDLCQDTLVAALARPARHDSAPRAWLARILRRLAIDRGRREGERAAREGRAGGEHDALDRQDPPAILAEIELARSLLEAVERLREPYRSTLYRRYYRGLAPQGIASEEGVPLKTVKTRLARGLELLRHDLDRRPGGREAWVALLLPLARSEPPAAPTSGPLRPVGSLTVPVAVATATLAVLGITRWAWGERESAARVGRELPAASIGRGPERTEVTVSGPPAREAARVGPEALAPRSGVRLLGTVLDEEERGLSGVVVRARVQVAEGPEGAVRGRPRRVDEGPEATTRSGGDGAFALELSEAGLVRLTLEQDGYAPRAWRAFAVDGQVLTLEPLALAPGVRREGTLRDPSGAPVAGAELLLALAEEGLLGPGRPERDGALLPVATSDEHGRFRLTTASTGAWRLEVRAPGYAALQASAASGPAEPLSLTLEPSASLAGEILALAADDLPRLRVLAHPAAGAARSVQPDARGRFQLDGLARGTACELVLIDVEGGGGPCSEPLRGEAGGPAVQLVARPLAARVAPAVAESELSGSGSARLGVRVRTADGRPVPGALVVRRDADGSFPFAPREMRVTGEDGRVDWDGLAAGEHAFGIRSGRFGPSEDGDWQVCRLVAGVEHELELVHPGRADVHGVVRAAGRGLVGARVVLRPEASRAWGALAVQTDGKGRFAFPALFPGSYALEVLHEERAQGERRSLVLGENGAELWIELAEARLAGRVLDSSGRGVPGARIHLRGAHAPGGFARPARAEGVLTDESGHFELVGVDPDGPLVLSAEAAGLATLQREVLWPTDPLQLVLVPEVLLTLALEGPARPFLVLQAEGPHGERLDFGLEGHTTVLRGLGPGRWRLVLRAPRGGRHEPLEELALELADGEPRTASLHLP